jgi:hypothetical protein
MTFKLASRSLVFLALSSGLLLAQGPKVAHTVHTGPVVPARETPATTVTLFTNLGPSAADLYNDTTGYYVLGPSNSVGDSEQWIGLPFTAKVSAHVTVLQLAIGWISGTKGIDVGLYADDGTGNVGAVLASGHSTKIPAFGTCCQLVSVTLPATAITAGSQYWVVATSDDTHAPDFTGVFQASNSGTVAYNPAIAGWTAFSTNTPAAAVKGTVP